MGRNNMATIGAAIAVILATLIGCENPFVRDDAAKAVAEPVFSHSPGVYAADFELVLSTDTNVATIYFATDGSDPTNSGTVCTEPIPVVGHGDTHLADGGGVDVFGDGTVKTVSAIAAKEGMVKSAVARITITMDYSLSSHSLTIEGSSNRTVNGETDQFVQSVNHGSPVPDQRRRRKRLKFRRVAGQPRYGSHYSRHWRCVNYRHAYWWRRICSGRVRRSDGASFTIHARSFCRGRCGTLQLRQYHEPYGWPGLLGDCSDRWQREALQ